MSARLSVFNFFPKKDKGPSRGASIILQCKGLTPGDYLKAGMAIRKMGLTGVMEMTKYDQITLQVEGPHAMIEKFLKETTGGLFGYRCENELVWKTVTHKHHEFTARPFLAGHPPEPKKK